MVGYFVNDFFKGGDEKQANKTDKQTFNVKPSQMVLNYRQRVRVVKECDQKSHGLARAGSNPAAVDY